MHQFSNTPWQNHLNEAKMWYTHMNSHVVLRAFYDHSVHSSSKCFVVFHQFVGEIHMNKWPIKFITIPKKYTPTHTRTLPFNTCMVFGVKSTQLIFCDLIGLAMSKNNFRKCFIIHFGYQENGNCIHTRWTKKARRKKSLRRGVTNRSKMASLKMCKYAKYHNNLLLQLRPGLPYTQWCK